MSHIAAHPGDHENQLQGGKTQDHHRSLEGKYAPNVNDRRREKHGKSQLNRKYSPGRSHERYTRITGKQVSDKRKKPCEDSGEKIIEKKFPAPHVIFHLPPKNKEGKHVKYKVPNGTGVVDKHIGNKLPNPAPAYHQYRVHGEIRNYRYIPEKHFRQVNQYIESDEYKHYIVVSVPKRPFDDVHNIWKL